MAIKACKECEKEVSTKADKCPHCGYVLKRKIGFFRMVLLLFVLLIIANAIIKATDDKSELSLNDRYPSPWRSDTDINISRAIVTNNIGSCGQYKYRESKFDKGEYLVHCTSDGINWIAYFVWAKIGRVTGPHLVDPSLNSDR